MRLVRGGDDATRKNRISVVIPPMTRFETPFNGQKTHRGHQKGSTLCPFFKRVLVGYKLGIFLTTLILLFQTLPTAALLLEEAPCVSFALELLLLLTRKTEINVEKFGINVTKLEHILMCLKNQIVVVKCSKKKTTFWYHKLPRLFRTFPRLFRFFEYSQMVLEEQEALDRD